MRFKVFFRSYYYDNRNHDSFFKQVIAAKRKPLIPEKLKEDLVCISFERSGDNRDGIFKYDDFSKNRS